MESGPCKGFCPENACCRTKQRNRHKAIYGPDSKFLAIRRRYENENDSHFDFRFGRAAHGCAFTPCAGSFEVSAFYSWNEPDHSVEAYGPKGDRFEGDSCSSSNDSGTGMVAAECSRSFVPTGSRQTNAFLLLQRRALQDFGNL